jgi:hypothetical protein
MRTVTGLGIMALCGGMYYVAVLRLLKGLWAQRMEGGVYDAASGKLRYGANLSAPTPWLGPRNRTGVVVWVASDDPTEVLGMGEARPIPPVAVVYFAVATALLMGYVFGWLRATAYDRLIKKRTEAATRTPAP